MPEPSASPVMQRHLSVDELKAIVSNSMSQLSSLSHATAANGAQHDPVLGGEDSVSLSLPPMASHQHHRSSPPRPKRSGENGRGRDAQASVPHSLRLDREANRMPVLPPDTRWTPPPLPSPRNYQSSPPKQSRSMLSGREAQSEASTMTDLHASSRKLAAEEQELQASEEQLLRHEKGLRESQVSARTWRLSGAQEPGPELGGPMCQERLVGLERELTKSRNDLAARTGELEGGLSDFGDF